MTTNFLPNYLSNYLSFYIALYLFFYLSNYLSFYLPNYLSYYLSSIYPLSIQISIFLSTFSGATSSMPSNVRLISRIILQNFQIFQTLFHHMSFLKWLFHVFNIFNKYLFITSLTLKYQIYYFSRKRNLLSLISVLKSTLFFSYLDPLSKQY